jgi:MFS family permease
MLKNVKIYSLLTIVIAFYCFDFYFRMSPSMIVPQLMQQYHVDALGIAMFASSFYFGYVVMQVPSGYLYNVAKLRTVIFSTMFLCTLCFTFFTYLHHKYIAYALRFLIGATSAFSFVGVLIIAKYYFAEKWFGFISSIAIAAGTLTSSLFQVISSAIMEQHSWQVALNLFTAIAFILCAVVLLVAPAKCLNVSGALDKKFWLHLRQFFSRPILYINALIGGLFYLPTSLFASLWGISFMEQNYPVDKLSAATGVTVLFLGWAVGSPIFGYLSVYLKNLRQLMCLGALVAAIVSGLFLYVNIQSLVYLYCLLFIFGVCSAAQVLSWSVYIQHCPAEISSTGMAITNMLIMSVAAVFQLIVGRLLDANGGQMDFQIGLSLMPIALLLTAILAWIFIRD